MKDILTVIEENGVELKEEGTLLRAFCPFHEDTNKPNFTVYPETDSWFCPEVDTPVLLVDLTWKKAKDLKVGDKLVGIEEIPVTSYRKFVLSEVKRIRVSSSTCFAIHTNRGIHVGSKQHLFLSRHLDNSVNWRSFELPDTRYRTPKFLKYLFSPTNYEDTNDYRLGYLRGYFDGDGSCGSRWYKSSGLVSWWDIASTDLDGLKFIQESLCIFGFKFEIKPFNHGSKLLNAQPMFSLGTHNSPTIKKLNNLLVIKSSLEFKRGYLAGIFDAEGTREQVTIYNQDLTLLNRVKKYGEKFNFRFRIALSDENKPNFVHTIYIQGDVTEQLRFFSVCNSRIQRKRDFAYYVGKRYSSKKNEVVVRKVEDVGIKQVVEIETSSKTLITAGFISHNCFACNEGGDVISFVAKLQNISREEAKKLLIEPNVDLDELQQKIDGLFIDEESLHFNDQLNILVSKHIREFLQKYPEQEKKVFEFLQKFDNQLLLPITQEKMQKVLEDMKQNFFKGE